MSNLITLSNAIFLFYPGYKEKNMKGNNLEKKLLLFPVTIGNMFFHI